jgi:TatD DNase family protein
MIIDTHAHLDFGDNMKPSVIPDSSVIPSKARIYSPNFEKIEAIIKRAEQSNVLKIINIGCNMQCSKNSIILSEKFDNVYASIGIHPSDITELSEQSLKELYEMAKNNKKVVAVGEIGLDYFHMSNTKETQKEGFIKQLNLAKELNLPIIVHCREAYDDTLEIITKENPKNLVFHCFSGNLEFAEILWSRGYSTSFTGVITYPKTEILSHVVYNCPMDKFFVETDAPFLAPQPYRGKTNEPAFVIEVIKKIAEIKEKSFDEIEKISTKNAEKFFSL